MRISLFSVDFPRFFFNFFFAIVLAVFCFILPVLPIGSLLVDPVTHCPLTLKHAILLLRSVSSKELSDLSVEKGLKDTFAIQLLPLILLRLPKIHSGFWNGFFWMSCM